MATKPGSEILLAAVPALLGLGDGLINVQSGASFPSLRDPNDSVTTLLHSAPS